MKSNGVRNAGVEDQLPILIYSIVKSSELRLYSNAEFMKLYIGGKNFKLEEFLIIQLLSTCEFITNLKYQDLIDVSYDEFNTKCNEMMQ